jgi:hypothetical protein
MAKKLAIPTVDQIDGRSSAAKRMQSIKNALTRDLGDDLSAAQKILVSKAAVLAVALESADAAATNGVEIDLAIYGTAASHLRRILETLGLRRVPKDITPKTLDSYLAERAGPT